jgi:hypothetical protein
MLGGDFHPLMRLRASRTLACNVRDGKFYPLI